MTYTPPHTPHFIPTSAPFLPTNPLQSRNFATPLEMCAHTYYPHPREESTPQPGIRTPKRGKAPGIRRGVPRGRPVAVKTRLTIEWTLLRPPVPLCHAVPHLCPNNPRRALQINAAPAAPSATRRAGCRRKEQISPPRFHGGNGVGGAKQSEIGSDRPQVL